MNYENNYPLPSAENVNHVLQSSDKMCRPAVEEEMDTLLYVLWNTVFKVILLFVSNTRINLPNTRERLVVSHTVSRWKTNCICFLSGFWGHCRSENTFENTVCFFFLRRKREIILWLCFLFLFFFSKILGGAKFLLRQELLLLLAFKFPL